MEQNTFSFADVLVGASILGKFSCHPAILAGEVDREISIFIHHKETGRLPQTEEDLKNPIVLENLDKLKNVLRQQYQDRIAALAESKAFYEKRYSKEPKFLSSDTAKEMHKPAPEGTVAELAEKFGKSKSEIRRLKAENKLHTLFEGD